MVFTDTEIKVGVLVVDDLKRGQILQELQKDKGIAIHYGGSSMEDLENAVGDNIRMDVLVLDQVSLGSHGCDIPKSIRHCLLVSSTGETMHFQSVLYAGVKGFFDLDDANGCLCKAIRSLRMEGGYISPTLAAQVLDEFYTDPLQRYQKMLTPREAEIIDLVCKGMGYKEISEKLFITRYAVNQHLKRVYVKMGVHSKVELMLKIVDVK